MHCLHRNMQPVERNVSWTVGNVNIFVIKYRHTEQLQYKLLAKLSINLHCEKNADRQLVNDWCESNNIQNLKLGIVSPLTLTQI